jgi:hypothetical protein
MEQNSPLPQITALAPRGPELLVDDPPEGLPWQLKVRRVELAAPARLVSKHTIEHVYPVAAGAGVNAGKQNEFIVQAHELCADGLWERVTHEKPAV